MRDVANIERMDRDGAKFNVRRHRLSYTFSRLKSFYDRSARFDRVRSWINIRYPFIDYLQAAETVPMTIKELTLSESNAGPASSTVIRQVIAWVRSEGQEDRCPSYKQTMYISGLVRVNDEIRPGRVTVLRFLYLAVPMEGIPRTTVHPKPFRRPLRNRDPELQAAGIARFFLRSKSLQACRRVLGTIYSLFFDDLKKMEEFSLHFCLHCLLIDPSNQTEAICLLLLFDIGVFAERFVKSALLVGYDLMSMTSRLILLLLYWVKRFHCS